MSFNDDDNYDPTRNNPRLKKVGAQKSMFDGKVKKPTQSEFEEQVNKTLENNTNHKMKVAEFAMQFRKIMADKTVPQNKNLFSKELEAEVLTKMIRFASEINNDPNEPEGEGSLGWIALLFTTCIVQRDRINLLEYKVSQISNKLDTMSIDKKKIDE